MSLGAVEKLHALAGSQLIDDTYMELQRQIPD